VGGFTQGNKGEAKNASGASQVDYPAVPGGGGNGWGKGGSLVIADGEVLKGEVLHLVVASICKGGKEEILSLKKTG